MTFRVHGPGPAPEIVILDLLDLRAVPAKLAQNPVPDLRFDSWSSERAGWVVRSGAQSAGKYGVVRLVLHHGPIIEHRYRR